MKAEYKIILNRIIALIMSFVILIPLSSCTIVIKEKQITKILIQENTSIRMNFEENEFRYYNDEQEQYVSTYGDEENMQSYEEFMHGFCRRIFNERNKYVIDNYEEAVAGVWTLIVTYEDGSYRRLDVTEGAEKRYPDDWNEFVERTNAMIDYELFKKI